MNSTSLSIGYLDNAVYLLKQVSPESGIKLNDLEELANSDEIRLRGTGDQILQSAINFGWLRIESQQQLRLPDGLHQLLLEGDFQSIQRELLWHYILNSRPRWIRYLGHGTDGAKQHIDNMDVKQVFTQLGLFVNSEDSDPSIAKWWNRAANFSRSIVDEKLKEIGNRGEFLSINFEFKRTGLKPKHMALDSDMHGYDIHSQFSTDDEKPLRIEVKASQKMRKAAKLYLSRNEFEKCIFYGDEYQFHLWDLYIAKKPKLLIVPGNEILKHTPVDSGEGVWKTVEIAFNLFDWSSCKSIEEVHP